MWEPVEAFSVDILTHGGSGFLVVEEDLCMVQNESEHLLPATYCQQHCQRRCWHIAGDCSVFFPYFVLYFGILPVTQNV